MTAEWIRKAAERAFPDHLVTVAGVTVVGVSRADERSAFIAGVEAGLAKAAEVVEAIPAEFYPEDIWPDTTSDQIVALHEFAKSIGLPDGSRFHVAGVRHGFTLGADAIRALGSDEKGEDR